MTERIKDSRDVLEVVAVSKSFGGVVAVADISFALAPGQVMGVIGPNGAGKTTLVNVIAGRQRPNSGRISIGGIDTTGKASHVVSRAGLARSFQQANVFGAVSVGANLEWAERFSRGHLPEISTSELIEISGLSDVLAVSAGDLPYGKQKALGVALALACRPLVVLLDEPAAGLETSERFVIDHMVRYVSGLGCAVLIVEHDMDLIRRTCPDSIVLDSGRVLAVGPTGETLSRPDVVAAYLGVEDAPDGFPATEQQRR